MKIGFFSFGILEQGGGYENFVINVAAGIRKQHPDADITIVTCSDRIVKKLQSLLSFYYFKKQPASSIYREDLEGIKAKLGDAKYVKIDSFRDLKKTLQSFEVLHAKNEILELTLLSLFGFNKLPPIITGIHTAVYYPYAPSIQAKLHNTLYLFAYRRLRGKIAKVYVQNDDDLALLRDKIGYGQATLIHQAITLEPTKIVENASDSLRLFFAGRLSEAKGVDVLIECLEILSRSEDFRKLEFRLAGSGETHLEQALTKLASKFSNVTYLGHIPHEKMGALYDWCDAAFIPSRYETLNKIAIEAGIHGKISIVSNVPGPRSIVKNAQTGFVVDLNAALFADTVLKLLKVKNADPKALLAMGEEAQSFITDTFRPDRAFVAMYELLKEARDGS